MSYLLTRLAKRVVCQSLFDSSLSGTPDLFSGYTSRFSFPSVSKKTHCVSLETMVPNSCKMMEGLRALVYAQIRVVFSEFSPITSCSRARWDFKPYKNPSTTLESLSILLGF